MSKSKTKKEDVFFITDEEIADTKKEVASVSSGIICPKRNKSIGGTCKVCDYIQTQIYSKKYDKKHKAMVWAREKKAKLAWFANVVFPENPDKSILFELGDKAGNQIVSGVEKLGWRDIVHPHKGVGRELICLKDKKQGDDWPTYTVNCVQDKADWEIPEKVWKNVPDLNNIIEILQTEEQAEENYKHIRSIKMGETITFRLCPPRTDVAEGDKRRFIAPVFRHWGVSEGQITGDDPLNWTETMEDEDKPSVPEVDEKLDLSFTKTSTDSVKDQVKEAPEKIEKKKPNCYGDGRFFEEDDKETCGKCGYFKPCLKTVAMG
jgi:ribosomal protein S27AE